ncbi:oligoribonuclease [Nicotiana attenuata]|uniref:Oligoribonuclease n=1 Tax=Nicotiana attenuata TaxID=49451 RepID=A0A314LGA6_NICAT|nr:oligoribonuclease [Nicotiana attenuata]
MNQISNAFSLLNLDVADSQDETRTDITNGGTGRVNRKGKGKDKYGSPGEMEVLEHEKEDQKSVSGEYKLPLVWIDLEMTEAALNSECQKTTIRFLVLTVRDSSSILSSRPLRSKDAATTFNMLGTIAKKLSTCKHFLATIINVNCLNIEVDRILEIACVVTDGNLTKSIEGPDLVINQPKECLDKMGEWCQEHHAASGLTERVLKSTVTEEEAEKQVIEFVKRNIGTYTPLLAGNSVYVDFQFLKKYMPNLASLFSHVLVDVSSVKALCVRWFPRGKTSTRF